MKWSDSVREFETVIVAYNIEDAKSVLYSRENTKQLWCMVGGISAKIFNAKEAEIFFNNPMGYINKEKNKGNVVRLPEPLPPPVAPKPVVTTVLPKLETNTPHKLVYGDVECPQCNGTKVFITDALKIIWASEIKAFGKRKSSDVCSQCKGRGIVRGLL
jgi:hypothetical protein